MHQNCINICGVLKLLLTVGLVQNLIINNVCGFIQQRSMLSDYIQTGDVAIARSLSEVNGSYMLDIKSYAGHITVIQREIKANLWFWYFPIEEKSKTGAPLVIWLQGGPSISSLMGLFGGVGPFNYKDGNLTKNPFSWNKNHSVLFIDNPVGTGFSYTPKEEGYSTNLDEVSTNLYNFLLQFLEVFPELKDVPLFLAGQSYAGKFIPALAHRIHIENLTSKKKINLKGMAIGNGWIDPPNLIGISEPAYTVGLIELFMKTELEKMEKSLRTANDEGNWKEANKMLNDILNSLKFEAEVPSLYNYVSDKDCYDPSYIEFIQRSEIKKCLHVSDITYFWKDLKTREMMEPDKMTSVVPFLETLLGHYSILFYNGQLDMMVPYINLKNVYQNLKWNGSSLFNNTVRQPIKSNNKLIGYSKRLGNFQEVLIRNVGHCVASEVPELLAEMITSFTHNTGRYGYEEPQPTTTTTSTITPEIED